MTVKGIKWVPSNKFAAQNYFLDWMKNTETGRRARYEEKVGVVDSKITYMQVSALSVLKTDDKLPKKESEYSKWENFAR